MGIYKYKEKNEWRISYMINEKNIKNKIKKELGKIVYNFSYKGTSYLIETIYILYKSFQKKANDCNFEDEIYPIVAQKYNTSANNVKCNIRNATDKMFYDCDEKVLREYLRDYEFSKPGAKRIALKILERL